MERYLELIKELKALGVELINNEEATDEVENLDLHLDCAIEIIEKEMKKGG